jgi:precorrin-6Y C5,15-methyltransferase (decarboxylating)
MDALRPGGRLVVNAVTLEAEATLLACRARPGGGRLGGELIRIAIARAEQIGRMEAWRSAMPLTQWTWVKP